MITVKQFADILNEQDEAFLYKNSTKIFAKTIEMVYVLAEQQGNPCWSDICLYGAIDDSSSIDVRHDKVFVEKNRVYQYKKYTYKKEYDKRPVDLDIHKHLTDSGLIKHIAIKCGEIVTNIKHEVFKYKCYYPSDDACDPDLFNYKNGIVFHIDDVTKWNSL